MVSEAQDRLRERLAALVAAGENAFAGRHPITDQAGTLRAITDTSDGGPPVVLLVARSVNGTAPGAVAAFGQDGDLVVILVADGHGRVSREVQLTAAPFGAALLHPGVFVAPGVAPVVTRVRQELGIPA